MRELNILITAASRRVVLIQSFLQALKHLGIAGNVIATDMSTLSPGLYFSDRHYLVPLTTDENYIPIIKSICFKERIHLIIPTIDDELPIFGAYAEEFLAMGVRVVVSEGSTGTICNDKYRTAGFLQNKGLPFAETWLPEHLDFSQLSYPLFIKPRRGRGSVGCHKIENEQQLLFFLDYVPDPVIQRFLTGREFTIDVLTDFEGEVLSVVPRERLVIRSGVSDRGRTWNNPEIVALGIQAAEALKIRGPANVQIMWADGKGTLFEVNPRFSGGIGLTIAAGADFPSWLLEMRMGKKLRPMLGEFTEGLVMTCYESALFLHSAIADGGERGEQLPQVSPVDPASSGERAVVAAGPWLQTEKVT
jgi:carbamoyl-phosphate synthase large subunit